MKKIGIAGGVICLLIIVFFYGLYNRAFAPTDTTIPNEVVEAPDQVTTIAENLNVPWEIRQLPSGDWLVTERVGTLARISAAGEIMRLTVPAIEVGGEGGLLGMALHPNFVENRWLYLYRTAATPAGRVNEVVRFRYEADHRLRDETIILADIPGARYHDGGRTEFGSDGYLYVATGDAGVPELAQDTNSLAGKILRMTDLGEIPEGNPFANYTYSYGHRNPQGIAWDAAGQLWSTEHGRSGVQSGMDELNRIEIGANYGWPVIEGDEANPAMETPVLHSGPAETWAPASLTIVDNTAYFAGLRGVRLYATTLSEAGTATDLRTYFADDYGRLRTGRVIDDALYLMTSNTDGRGNPQAGDDRLVRVPLAVFLSE